MLLTIPLLTAGFSLISSVQQPRVWVMVWLVSFLLVGMILLLAVIDTLNTVRIGRDAAANSATRSPLIGRTSSISRATTKPSIQRNRPRSRATMARNQRPPLPALGTPLEPLYRTAVNRRNRDFDIGRRVTRLPIPVVSVGNISVGGTGKTPMVRWIINTLRDLEANPGIAMRGYGRKHAGVSDEQQEHADRLPDTPIVANPDRVAAIRTLIEQHHTDCAVLDDGFQHRFAARDLDVVLIDATRSPFADRCLPAGWLREPVESLARAHAIVITRSTLVDPHALSQLDRQLRRIAPDALVVRADHHWAALETQFGVQPVSWLNGRPTIIACAIGNPDAFIAQARARGARHRRDHPPRPSQLDTPRSRPHPESRPSDHPTAPSSRPTRIGSSGVASMTSDSTRPLSARSWKCR